MTARIPPAALLLGLAGLIPFLWSAASATLPAAQALGAAWLLPMFMGRYVGLTYGTVILSFMSGVLWGFASRGTAALPYVLSVIPALWAFGMVTDASDTSVIYLIAGFLGLLLLDASFAAQGLAPGWWLRLRLGLTLVVVVCLGLPLVLNG